MTRQPARRELRLGGMRSFLVLLVVLLALSACGDDGSSVDVGGSGDLDSVGTIDGRRFLLQSETGFGLVEDTTVSVRFADGSISADAGCNSIGGTYEIDGDTLVVGDVQMTEMGCEPPRNAQDDALVAFLTDSPDIALDGDILVLETSDVTMEFLDSEIADPDRPLVGTTWQLDGFIDGETASSPPAGIDVTLVVEPDPAKIRFEGLCESVELSLDADLEADLSSEGELEVGDVGSTLVDCAGTIETSVTAVFSDRTVEYSIDAAALTITNGDKGLMFSALE